jgi:hypothetical protein
VRVSVRFSAVQIDFHGFLQSLHVHSGTVDLNRPRFSFFEILSEHLSGRNQEEPGYRSSRIH